MAVVRFSEQLKHDITQKAKDNFDKRENAAVATILPTAEMRQYLLEQGLGPMRAKMDALPTEFFENVSYFSLSKFGPFEANLRFDLPAPMRWPERMQVKHDGMKFRTMGYHNQLVEYTPDLTNAEDMALYERFKARAENIAAIKKTRDEYVAGVRKICDTYTTLSPALKAWPPLWELLPEYAKQRHQEISERKSAKAAALDGVDLESLTVQSTIIKMVR
jgi:hypothetical protein